MCMAISLYRHFVLKCLKTRESKTALTTNSPPLQKPQKAGCLFITCMIAQKCFKAFAAMYGFIVYFLFFCFLLRPR